MKKITKILPIIMVVLITALMLIYIDYKEASVYLKFNNFERETISIEYDNNNINLVNNVKKIQNLAKENNVILLKSNVSNEKEKALNIYLSVDSIDELYTLLNENFKIKKLNSVENKDSNFISTYVQNNDNQIGIINDLFGDQYYTYYLMNQMYETNDNTFGEYFVFYKDFQDYSNFMNELNELMGADMHSISISNGIQGYIGVLIIGSFVFLSLFYFIFQIYDYNNNSKKIGCMKLLGFDINRINKNMIYKNLKIYVISALLACIIAMIFVKNIMLYHLFLVFILNCLIIFITYLLSFVSCYIISKSYQITSILKSKNVSIKISNVSYIFKAIMTVMLLCFMIIAFQNFEVLSEKLKKYNSAKDLLDYGVYQSYVVNQPEVYDYEKQHDLYLNIISNMDTFYAQFADYSQYTSDDWVSVKEAEDNGTFYSYDSVDINYLKKEKIKVYDLNNKEIDISSINSVCFLFPKSKKELINSFKQFNSDVDDYYKKFNSEYEFSAYLYDDQKVNTYQIDYKYIDSPILRVIDGSLENPYFTDGLGTSFFGNGLITGLKIKLIDNDKNKTIEMLNKYCDQTNMSNLFSASSFITYKEYFNDEIVAGQLMVLFLFLSIVIILSVYILISFQLVKLYIKGQQKRVLVKKLLGFKNSDIFAQVYKKNLDNTLISIVLSLVILIIIKKFNLLFGIISIIILILDYIVTMVTIKTTNLSKIHLDLKGGNND